MKIPLKLWVFLTLLIVAMGSSGCNLLKVDPGADPLVVETERAENVAFDTFDAFVKFEYENHDLLLKIDPGIVHYANIIRAQSTGWLRQVNDAKRNYKAVKTATNKSVLQTLLAMIRDKTREADHMIAVGKEAN